MKEFILKALFLAAKQLAGVLLPRIVQLIQEAQEQFGSGSWEQRAEKKRYLMERLQEERAFFGSALWALAPVWLSAVLDVIVAWVKTRQAQ
jgi:hypothetical protein